MSMPAPPQWFIRAQGRLYGPYGLEQMRAFAAEQRLGGQSMTSRSQNGPFQLAADDPALAGLVQPRPGMVPAQQQKAAQRRRLVIMAVVADDNLPAFMDRLSGFGVAIALFKNFWLLNAAFSAEHVRNALSQELGREDALFIADASHGASSWFNIGQVLDRRIRQFWQQQP